VVLSDGTTAVLGRRERVLQLLTASPDGSVNVLVDSLDSRGLSLIEVPEGIGVWYPGHQQLQLIDRLGNRVGIETLFAGADMVPDLEYALSGAVWPRRQHGRLSWWGDRLVTEVRPEAGQDDGPTTLGYLVAARRGDPAGDTIAAIPTVTYSMGEGMSRVCCGFPKVFDWQPVWATGAEGALALSASGQAGYSVYGGVGELEFTVGWPSRSQPVSDEGILSHYKAWAVHEEPDSPLDDLVRAFRKNMALNRSFFARALPDATGMLAGPEGRLWVRQADSRRPFALSSSWDVLEWDGTPIERVHLPNAYGVFGFRGDSILATVLQGPVEKVVWYAPESETP